MNIQPLYDRMPEQFRAAQEVPRHACGRSNRPLAHYSTPPIRNRAGAAVDSTAKADIWGYDPH